MFREPFDEPEMEQYDAGLPDIAKLFAHLRDLEKQYGVVITVAVPNGIEEIKFH
jgi:hypothetical protein